MTKMLDVLESFLNYHGYIYLRLDGTTRVEQRQVTYCRFSVSPWFFLSYLNVFCSVSIKISSTIVKAWNAFISKICSEMEV